MSDEIALDLTREDGSVEQERVPISLIELNLTHRQLVAVSNNIAQLTRVTLLRLNHNAFAEIPSGVLVMTQLTHLILSQNRLTTIPREIGRLRALTHLYLFNNKLVALPREIGQLVALKGLHLYDNVLTSLPAELGQLSSLQVLSVRPSLSDLPKLTRLQLHRNSLAWLPMELDRLPAATKVYLNGNPLPIDVGDAKDFPRNSRAKLPELFAATTALAMIRDNATTLAVGLQDLELPALVTLEIIDAAFPNSIPMHRKWDLVTAVKHFHERRSQQD